MILIPYKRSGRILVALFTLPLFLSLGFQRVAPLHNTGRPLTQAVLTRETIAAGGEQSVPTATGFASEAAATCSAPARKASSFGANGPLNPVQFRVPIKVPIKVETVIKSGPVFPAVFSMSDFSVQGVVKGDGWVILIDYELEPESTATVTIWTSKTIKNKKPFAFQLQPANHNEVIQVLPFGNKPEVGAIGFQAFKNDKVTPARFILYGLAVGRRGEVVGSLVVNQLKFQPPNIRPKLKEKASYSFHALRDFNSGSVDFMLATFPKGVLQLETAATEKLKDGVGRDEQVARVWDGKNDKGKVSPGRYQFRVSTWRGLKSGGEWVSVLSQEVVKVE